MFGIPALIVPPVSKSLENTQHSSIQLITMSGLSPIQNDIQVSTERDACIFHSHAHGAELKCSQCRCECCLVSVRIVNFNMNESLSKIQRNEQFGILLL